MCTKLVTDQNGCCFDFDHLDPSTKEHDISRMGVQKYREEQILSEIRKCRLLCCNCHRLHTIKQSNNVDYYTYNYDEDIKNLKIIYKIVDKPPKIDKKCIDCKASIYRTATRCEKCNSFSKRKVERPTKEVLLTDISKLGYCATGRKYGVTDNAIRKWIKSM